MKVSQWIAAVGIAAGVVFGAATAAVAAPAPATPACPGGAVTIVTDENGVQQQACVAVAVEAPPAPQLATLVAPTESAPVTGTMPAHATLPSTGIGSGGLVIAAVLVGSGSIVSLLSRRRPLVRRKGFRGRRITP